MFSSNQITGAQSPNDPKLSDSPARRDPCAEGGKAEAGSTGHDVQASSLQRMVRRIGSSHLWVDTTGEGIALAAAFDAAGIEVRRFHRASELPPRTR